jgi:phage/conjugal plasmid C-4 type zinc finger TraR family protein
MANGWARDGAVQEEIDARVKDAISLARSKLPSGESLTHCEACGASIPQARRTAIAGVRLCIECQIQREEQPDF